MCTAVNSYGGFEHKVGTLKWRQDLASLMKGNRRKHNNYPLLALDYLPSISIISNNNSRQDQSPEDRVVQQ